MRVWHQSMTELDAVPAYRSSLEARAASILGAGCEVSVHGLPAGSYRGRPPTAALSNAFASHRILDPILDHAIQAERAGFDAFVLGSFSEPFLTELRSALDIPVVSVTEANFLAACSIGALAATIVNDPAIGRLVQKSIEAHGLARRIQGPRSIAPPLDEHQLAEAYAKPSQLLDAFRSAARIAIRDGADVVIPAEGVLSEFLCQQQVTEVDGVPVLDAFAVAWLHARMMVDLRARTGLAVSRSGRYRRDDPELVAALSPVRSS
jgi:allantoin racemase